jgi:glucosamine-6-phosphate deaminase
MRTSSVITTAAQWCERTDLTAAPWPGLDLRVLPSVEAVAHGAASALLRARLEQPERPLGLATGRTMAPVYAALAARLEDCSTRERSAIREHWLSFNLDEYVGLGPADAGSFAAEMGAGLREPLGLDPRRVRLPDGLAADPSAEASRYAEELRLAGGVGLQLLGLGMNGHVGFNEPPCGPNSRCRRVQLCASTRHANAAAFGGDPERVPSEAITLGLADILQADRILLVVTGAAKGEVLRRLLQAPPSETLPASWLHRHPSVCLLVDADALSA